MHRSQLSQLVAALISLNLILQSALVPVIFALESTSSAEPLSPETTAETAADPEPEPVVETDPYKSPPPDEDPATDPELLELAALIEADPAESQPDMRASEILPAGDDQTINASSEAQVINTATISAHTGTNTASGSGTATVYTGDATAIANIINAINTNFHDSQLALIAITPSVNDMGDIDLNQLWQQLSLLNNLITVQDSDAYPLTLTLFNAANVQTVIMVDAHTGANDLQGDGVSLTTGHALSLANVGQLINAQLFQAQVLFSFINILPGFYGNIILPRPPAAPETAAGSPSLSLTATASTSADLTATADTGHNSSQGETTTTSTGDAATIGSIVNYIDTLIINTFLYSFIINNLTGSPIDIIGWSNPIHANILELFFPAHQTAENDADTVIESTQQAAVSTTISTAAHTGLNNLTGTATSLATGTAKAAASLIEFTNLTITNGQLFAGVINIASDWFGQIIIAHPDLAIEVSPVYSEAEPGQPVNFILKMSNLGHDRARQPTASFTLPPQLEFAGSTCAYPQTMIGQTVTWQLPDLPQNTSLTCQVTGLVAADFNFTGSLTQNFSLVKTAHATGPALTQILTAAAAIETIDPELNLHNNSSTGQFTVVKLTSAKWSENNRPPSDATATHPELVIAAANNVAEYVYAQDTVTFFITVTNIGGSTAHHTQLIQTLQSPSGKILGRAHFDLGNIHPHRGGKLTFGITLPRTAATGVHITMAQAVATADSGESITSNLSYTSFRVIGTQASAVIGLADAAPAADPLQPQILGLSAPVCQLPFNPLPYVVIVIMNAAWFAWSRRHFPTSLTGKSFWAGTNLLMMLAAVYAVYALGSHYQFFPHLPWLETITRQPDLLRLLGQVRDYVLFLPFS
jgi:hypothetical protein